MAFFFFFFCNLFLQWLLICDAGAKAGGKDSEESVSLILHNDVMQN
jgi:hypothetical protein